MQKQDKYDYFSNYCIRIRGIWESVVVIPAKKKKKKKKKMPGKLDTQSHMDLMW